jgi:mRNA-degrading endonuclease RelE of RelBE toxin-antitoxin system
MMVDKLSFYDYNYSQMVPKRSFDPVYAPQVRDHLRAIEPKYHSLIRRAIEEQLQFAPDVQTRNHKPLRRSVAFETEWEIRFGPNNHFRVFYEIDHQQCKVYILAIGVQEGNRLIIGGEEIEL